MAREGKGCLGGCSSGCAVALLAGLALLVAASLASRRGPSPAPTVPAAVAPAPAGPDEATRREIYARSYAAGMEAIREADRRFPWASAPTDPEGARAFLEGRRSVYEPTRERGRAAIRAAYGIDEATLDRIDAEGTRGRWPLPR